MVCGDISEIQEGAGVQTYFLGLDQQYGLNKKA